MKYLKRYLKGSNTMFSREVKEMIFFFNNLITTNINLFLYLRKVGGGPKFLLWENPKSSVLSTCLFFNGISDLSFFWNPSLRAIILSEPVRFWPWIVRACLLIPAGSSRIVTLFGEL